VPSQPSLASFRENHYLQEVRVTLSQKFGWSVNRQPLMSFGAESV